MLEVPQKVQDLQALDREFEELRGDVGAPYLSQWTFERSLDRLASALSTYLSSQIDGKVGCSLLYLGEALDYHVGGSSTDRRTMQQSARHYDLRNSEQARSFTGYSLNHYTTFLLNDFPKACAKFSQVITHKAKSCEMPEHYTLSYVCIPAPIEGETARMVGDSDELVAEDPEKKNILALGAIRISSSSREIAKAIPNLLPNHMQRTVFSLIEEGRRKALLNRGNSALAIADLQTDLLQYRNKEFQGLDQLAFHIQTLFGDCQCSIFIAHEKQKTISAGRREVALYLAATTALSPSEQHVRFRRKFFDQNEHYSCYFDQSFRPLPGELESCTKTALAYYRPEEPVCENQNTGSKRFAGHGELRTAGFFLALAIPAPKPQDRPYGVIRIVRESRETFSEEERRLAAAIARALTYWLDFFPKAEDLEIDWVSESQRVRILKTLFGIISFVKTDPSRVDLLGKAEVELNWLLEKIFCNCKKISITQIFGGKSGAVALLVKNDSGRDLILKCSYRPPGEAQAENDITREVRNYSQFIEGKLQLNHNVIYPELIRETRNLVGFATSFLDSQSRNRVSITQFCKQARSQLSMVEWSLAQVVEKLVTDVWAWWYLPEQMCGPETIEMSKFLETLLEDRLFSFLFDLGKLDERVVRDLKRVLGQAAIGTTDFPAPSELWTRFKVYVKSRTKPVIWQTTVTHGDAHGDNIFFDPQSLDMWIIDFARTGVRANVFDLAMIESDLKFRGLANFLDLDKAEIEEDFWKQIYKFEAVLASQKLYERPVIPALVLGDDLRPLRTVGKLVIDIRQLACQVLGRSGSFDDYRVVLFLLAFKYMKLSDATPRRRTLAYLAALALVDKAFKPKRPPAGTVTERLSS